ncbi:MAG: hypothetical protein ACFFDN_42145 [Candidatus Hodarchaeota archaeon]
MSSEESATESITELKQKVKAIIGEVNDLKADLQKGTITLEKFREKKDILENILRGILEKISQYKEKGTPEQKIDAGIAEQANKLMYEFQTDFLEIISRAKVYISASLDDHFVFDIDFSNYPGKPKLIDPEIIRKKISILPLETKIPCLTNWDPQNPSNIVEIFYDVERILLNIIQGEDTEGLDLNEDQIKKIQERQKLKIFAELEIESKNIEKAIEIYKKIVQISHELEDHENVRKYSEIIRKITLNSEDSLKLKKFDLK